MSEAVLELGYYNGWRALALGPLETAAGGAGARSPRRRQPASARRRPTIRNKLYHAGHARRPAEAGLRVAEAIHP